MPFALDVVEAHDDDGMVLEERDARREVPFEASDARCGERGGLEVEVPGQLGLPLLHEVRRAKHGEAVDLAAVP